MYKIQTNIPLGILVIPSKTHSQELNRRLSKGAKKFLFHNDTIKLNAATCVSHYATSVNGWISGERRGKGATKGYDISSRVSPAGI